MYEKSFIFPGLPALVPTIGAILVIVFSTEGSLSQRLLSSKSLVGIGLISYSVYLWHQPFFSLMNYHMLYEPGLFLKIGGCVIILAISYISWRFVELPFRKPGQVSNSTSIVLFLLCISLISSVGLGGHFTNGYDSRDVGFNALGFEPENKLLQDRSWDLLRDASSDPAYSVEKNASDNKLWFDSGDDRSKLLIVGNSYAKDLFNVLSFSETVRENFELARYGIQIESLSDSESYFYNSPNYAESQYVFLATKFDQEDINALNYVVGRMIGDGKVVVLVNNTVPFYSFNSSNNRSLADYVVLKVSEELNVVDNLESTVSKVNEEYYKSYISSRTDHKVLSLREGVEMVSKVYDVVILDRMDYICEFEKESCFGIGENLNKYFYDYGHHTIDGAKYFGSRVDQIGWLDEIL